jgi:hypothetical protein
MATELKAQSVVSGVKSDSEEDISTDEIMSHLRPVPNPGSFSKHRIYSAIEDQSWIGEVGKAQEV